MIPTLFEIGFFKVRSYGLMLALAFVLAWYLLRKGFQRRGWPGEIAYDVVAIAAISGVIGAKLFHVIDHWDTVKDRLFETVFSGSGLTFLGGPIVAAPAVLLFLKWRGFPALPALDAAAPALAAGQGLGRIGCLLAGDGCYGIPTTLPWGMTFPNGIVPTHVPVHPTPLYESAWNLALAGLLAGLDARAGGRPRPGSLFAAWMVLYGIERFLVEFIRTNPRYLFGLSQSQIISAVAIVAGGIWLLAIHLRGRAADPGSSAGAAA